MTGSDDAQMRSSFKERATDDRYATSPDFNLRELEIAAIARNLAAEGPGRVLDVGCGNGYSTICFAAAAPGEYVGADYLPEMVEAAEGLQKELAGEFPAESPVRFEVGDATELPFEDASFDTVISQRCLLNLLTWENQRRALDEVARVLEPGGRYLMLEGTLQGLQGLNEIREQVGLEAIPEANPETNRGSLKFDEREVAGEIEKRFSAIERIERFGMYYLLSRVVHPLLVAPEQPRYDADLNRVARSVALEVPDYEGIGHVALWVLRK
jgi:SAM-dependent methyltransferase